MFSVPADIGLSHLQVDLGFEMELLACDLSFLHQCMGAFGASMFIRMYLEKSFSFASDKSSAN